MWLFIIWFSFVLVYFVGFVNDFVCLLVVCVSLCEWFFDLLLGLMWITW